MFTVCKNEKGLVGFHLQPQRGTLANKTTSAKHCIAKPLTIPKFAPQKMKKKQLKLASRAKPDRIVTSNTLTERVETGVPNLGCQGVLESEDPKTVLGLAVPLKTDQNWVPSTRHTHISCSWKATLSAAKIGVADTLTLNDTVLSSRTPAPGPHAIVSSPSRRSTRMASHIAPPLTCHKGMPKKRLYRPVLAEGTLVGFLEPKQRLHSGPFSEASFASHGFKEPHPRAKAQ